MSKKRGLIFLMNDYPKKGTTDSFLVRKKYRFVPTFVKRDTIILIEIYKFNISVISFYDKKTEGSLNKFQERFKFSPGHVKSIFKACLEAFYDGQAHKHEHALIFHAANNANEIIEDNARYSAYKLFLSHYLIDYKEYTQQGSLSLNVLMLYHGSHQYKTEIKQFFDDFEQKVNNEIQEELKNLKKTIVLNPSTVIQKRASKKSK